MNFNCDKIINQIFSTIGPTAGDEMCNLYLMYYTPSVNDDFKTCGQPANQKIIRMLPENSDRLLQPPSMK